MTNVQKYEVGQRVLWKNKEYRIVGDDTSSTPHPSGSYPKWEYLLKDSEGNYKKISSDEISELLPVPS